ncbi:hypothetical protein QWZ04_23210 [Vibrio tapetis subsp. quintayensis]|uniref:hypothetical protein n=1 Tax=Vibrio tapetis TaxID=52443 RepID=UPI0025B304F0|nr:hypothetical protein [Vibrio tapetis]MDN3683220.1 hypothetical protein [Vibrio tapetis subsp. quintayensis]
MSFLRGLKSNGAKTYAKADSYDRFESRFRSKFPEEFELQKYTKKNRFKSWLKKQMAQLPKT